MSTYVCREGLYTETNTCHMCMHKHNAHLISRCIYIHACEGVVWCVVAMRPLVTATVRCGEDERCEEEKKRIQTAGACIYMYIQYNVDVRDRCYNHRYTHPHILCVHMWH